MGQEQAAERAREVVLGLLEAIHEHRDGTLAGEDPEELHDMRVATRRMRTAMRVLHEALPQGLLKLSDQFRWLGDVLGEVRDLDVQIESLINLVEAGDADAGEMAPIKAVLDSKREASRQSLTAALTGERYAALIPAAADALLWHQDAETGNERLAEFAARVSRERYRSLRRAARRLEPESADPEYHKVRKRARRLRYTLEFVYPSPSSPVRRVIARLVELQDLLGEHQDAAVSSALLRQISMTPENAMPPGTLLLAGRLIERKRARSGKIRRESPDILKRVRRAWKRMR